MPIHPKLTLNKYIGFDLCKMSTLCTSKWKGYRKQINLCNREGLNNKESGGIECKGVMVRLKKIITKKESKTTLFSAALV